jgi:hypothetical protein
MWMKGTLISHCDLKPMLCCKSSPETIIPLPRIMKSASQKGTILINCSHLKITAFWDVMLYSLVDAYQHFGGMCYVLTSAEIMEYQNMCWFWIRKSVKLIMVYFKILLLNLPGWSK